MPVSTQEGSKARELSEHLLVTRNDAEKEQTGPCVLRKV